MIKPSCFTIAWISSISDGHRNADKILIEKVIRALSLLEHLQHEGLDFIFKGGSALLLLLKEPRRFSIDIDIILENKPPDIETLFQSVVAKSDFSRFEENIRQSNADIPKAHYKFYYYPSTSARGLEEYILLDILFQENPYARIDKTNIECVFIETGGPVTQVRVPAIEGLLGDKLTAFAPNTTGIPYGQEKELEIIKQLFDIAQLFDLTTHLDLVRETFEKVANQELRFRNLASLSPRDVCEDIFQTSLCLCSRGMEGGGDFQALQSGITQIRNHIFSESYHIDKAIIHASKAAYLARLLMASHTGFAQFQNPFSVKDLSIEDARYSRLNKLKKTHPEAFFYWYEALKLV